MWRPARMRRQSRHGNLFLITSHLGAPNRKKQTTAARISSKLEMTGATQSRTNTPTAPIHRVVLKDSRTITVIRNAKAVLSTWNSLADGELENVGSVLGRYQPAASGRDGKPVAGLEVTNVLQGGPPECESVERLSLF